MNNLQKEFESTGYTSWINLDLYPDGKIYTKEYTEWLEKKVESLTKPKPIRHFRIMKLTIEDIGIIVGGLAVVACAVAFLIELFKYNPAIM